MDGYTCVCVDMYTHTYTYRHTHPCICHTCMHACMHTYTHRRRPRQEQPRSSCLRERAYDGRFGTRRARGGKLGPDHRSSGSVRVRGCWRCPFDLIGCLLALVSFAGIARAWVLFLVNVQRGQPTHVHAHACILCPSLSPLPPPLSVSLPGAGGRPTKTGRSGSTRDRERGSGSGGGGAGCRGEVWLDAFGARPGGGQGGCGWI